MSATISKPSPVAWRPRAWRRIIPIGHTKLYEEIARGAVQIVKVGEATLITTSPEQYLASLPRGLGSTNSARAVAARKAARAAA
jgi:hypothetical protein